MIAGAGKGGFRSIAFVLVVACTTLAAACGSSGGSDGAEATTTAATAPTSAADAPSTSAGASTTGRATVTSTTATPTSLPDATTSQRSAPGNDQGTALLKAVRVGSHPGFERIVFEFAGQARPGYRVQWVDGPITADGSGEPVTVDGEAHLEIVLSPASGVDLSAPQLTVVYGGPDRIPVAGKTDLITDLVRTGDFEAVLTWVAGATEEVPFRVVTLDDPSRIAIDLEVPAP